MLEKCDAKKQQKKHAWKLSRELSRGIGWKINVRSKCVMGAEKQERKIQRVFVLTRMFLGRAEEEDVRASFEGHGREE